MRVFIEISVVYNYVMGKCLFDKEVLIKFGNLLFIIFRGIEKDII